MPERGIELETFFSQEQCRNRSATVPLVNASLTQDRETACVKVK